MSTANLDSADLKAVKAGGLIREDVMNKIWDISKIPLPFTDLVGSGTHDQEFTEWTTDELAKPDLTNAVVDGADATGNDTKTGARVGNHSQISDKVVRVSYRADASNVIGRAKELAYQLMRRQQELRRDVEAISLNNQASVADNGDTVAGKVGGLPSWIKTSVLNGTAGGFDLTTRLTVARTPGTAKALAVSGIRSIVEKVYNEGGDSSVLMTIPGIISKLSEFMFTSSARIATLQSDQGKSAAAATALGAVNVFVTDFGTLRFVPNRLQQQYDDATPTTPKKAADVFILDPTYLELSYLKGYRTDELAKTGLAENRQMSVDWTLKVLTEKAQGLIGDIDPSVDVTA